MVYVPGLYDSPILKRPPVGEDINPVFPSHKVRVVQILQLMEDLLKDYKQGEYSKNLPSIPDVGMGDKHEAFRLLNEAYTEHDWQLLFVKIHPTFAPLRSDPRYADLIRRMNLTP